jgi:hypothetical protein
MIRGHFGSIFSDVSSCRARSIVLAKGSPVAAWTSLRSIFGGAGTATSHPLARTDRSATRMTCSKRRERSEQRASISSGTRWVRTSPCKPHGSNPERVRRLILIDGLGIPRYAAARAILKGLERLDRTYATPEEYIAVVRDVGLVVPWSEYWERAWPNHGTR